ncbi:MAG: InlB B-repeat-containing protein [Methanocorpusculum sp.]|nr:InlB B-repeat-containing protein [Methanocorpusculum sp.]
MNIKQTDGVAPVIAAVLLVALTVILAGAAALVFISMTSDTATNINTSSIYPTQDWNVLKVVYDGNGATEGAVPVDTNTYHLNDTVTVRGLGDVVKEGYRFIAWNTNTSGSGFQYIMGATFEITGYTTLYAQWVEKPADCIVIFHPNMPLVIMPTPFKIVSSGGSVRLPTLSNQNMHTFKGWSETPGGTVRYAGDETIGNIQNDLTLFYAVWS